MTGAPHRAALLLAAVALASCRREERAYEHPAPPSAADWQDTGLHVAQDNAFAAAQGKRLYVWMNCPGCHAHGGGAIGPPLLDNPWRYGASAEEVMSSILDGRPNGMPAYRGRITEEQAWQLTAYVRSMAGLLRPDVAPSRADELQAREPEGRTEHRDPRPEATP